ncbi:DUF2252 family protein [Leptolyngbyaceae cyanobacterium UHCC 1019]
MKEPNYSQRPSSHRPFITPYQKRPQIRHLTEVEFQVALEQVKREHRGVMLAIAQGELSRDYHVLDQRLIEVGIAEVGVEMTKQDFSMVVNKLIQKRFQAAMAFDDAAAAPFEWDLHRQGIAAKLAAMQMKVDSTDQKNLDDQEILKLRGLISQFANYSTGGIGAKATKVERGFEGNVRQLFQ